MTALLEALSLNANKSETIVTSATVPHIIYDQEPEADFTEVALALGLPPSRRCSVYPDYEQGLTVGDVAWVLKSTGKSASGGRLAAPARVLELNVSEAASVESQRALVQYHNGATYRARRTRLLRVVGCSDEAPRCIVVADTPNFRRIARIHARAGCGAVDVGCDRGEASMKLLEVYPMSLLASLPGLSF